MMRALREGMDEALFLAFREGCRYLKKWEADQVGTLYRCRHPGNLFKQGDERFYQGIFENDRPNCALEGCPIYKKLAQEEGPVQQFDAFSRRFEALPETKRLAMSPAGEQF